MNVRVVRDPYDSRLAFGIKAHYYDSLITQLSDAFPRLLCMVSLRRVVFGSRLGHVKKVTRPRQRLAHSGKSGLASSGQSRRESGPVVRACEPLRCLPW